MNIKKLLKNLKLHESTISIILGAVVIIVTGILVVNYFSGKNGEAISTVETEQTGLPMTHKIAEGEDLWKIAEKYYGSGYNWVDIAKENNISDPDMIEVGQEITIPDVNTRLADESSGTVPTEKPEFEVPDTLSDETENTGSEDNVYTVKEGENLWEIAEAYYGSGYNWVDIANANRLDGGNDIEVGQKLSMPDVETKVVTASTSQENPDAISGASYTVEKGDSLWKIAVRAYGDGYKWTDIAKENSLDNPGIIHPGNTLVLPR